MTYSTSLDTALSRVRFAVGDTDTANELVPDATYTALLTTQSLSEDDAAATIARYLITRYGQEPTRVSLPDGTTADFSERIKSWQALIADLSAKRGGMRISRLARPQLINGGTEYS